MPLFWQPPSLLQAIGPVQVAPLQMPLALQLLQVLLVVQVAPMHRPPLPQLESRLQAPVHLPSTQVEPPPHWALLLQVPVALHTPLTEPLAPVPQAALSHCALVWQILPLV